jgi:hypothetical protein
MTSGYSLWATILTDISILMTNILLEVSDVVENFDGNQ